MGALKRHAVKFAAAAGALFLLAGGIFWFGGGYDRWSTGRLMEEACAGTLPVEDIRSLLGDRSLVAGNDVVEGALEGEETSLRVECILSRESEGNTGRPFADGSVAVTISGVPTLNPEDRAESLYPPAARSNLPPAPLGQGWNAVFAGSDSYDDDASATTSVLLDCAAGRSDLLVTAQVSQDDSTLDNPARRLAFARVATRTAAAASATWGCDAKLGRPLTDVPLPINEDEGVPLEETTGSCAGIPANGKRVTHAWEQRTGPAPYEECELGSGRDSHVYTLTAHYGPFAEEAAHRNFERHDTLDGRPWAQVKKGELYGHGHWTSALCTGSNRTALYTVHRHANAQPTQADTAYEQAALRAFAERSAEERGCEAPASPGE
ncbi:hypothetical protein [Streptomyces indicus]|uniref:Uncharacterized protein n=1 Tax=Streptomyces indicus TaxID=417292 RepID=A0A1G9GQ09_9ACTN|nr:hypothetical protein [Streptomyces indicus]SDL02744.1 hypothetical protein SAMN05421806_116138 [Streptomyces indicus]